MDKQNVLITICGSKLDYDSSQTEKEDKLKYTGSLTQSGKEFIVKYIEAPASRENNQTETLTSISFKEGILSIEKQGEASTTMKFAKNKEYTFLYSTPYGNFEMKTRTSNLSVAFTEQDICIEINYDLYINSVLTTAFHKKINITYQ